MKIRRQNFVLITLLCAILSTPFKGSAQANNLQDSLALVDLYNSTNGAGWINHTNWLTAKPLYTWYGITMSGGRVSWINLGNNKLVGTIPSSLGNLAALNLLALNNNQISGSIPASLGNLSQSWFMDLLITN